MAGHSKWANIQHRKGAQDRKKAKIFSRLSKEITIAVKLGGMDPDANPRLRLAMRNARAESMPKDNIVRAIDKAGGVDGAEYHEIRYEGFAPGGVGLIMEVSTDNRNRAAAEIRRVFSRHGGNLGDAGSVSFGFVQLGEIVYPPEAGDEEQVLEAALLAGAEDVVSTPDGHVIYSERGSLAEVSSALEGAFGELEALSERLVWRPSDQIEVAGEQAEKLINMLEALEELDDVQAVFSNFVVSGD